MIPRFRFCTSKKFKVKPFTVFDNHMCFSMTPIRAVFKQVLGEVRLPKTGGILFEMIPYQTNENKQKVITKPIQEPTFLWQKKIFFDANIRNLGIFAGLILDLQSARPVRYQMQTQNNHDGQLIKSKLTIQSQNQHNSPWFIKMKSIISQGKTSFKVNPNTLQLHKSEATSSNTQNFNYKINLTRTDILLISELARYSLPYLLGWDVIEDNKTIGLPGDTGKY